MIGESGGKFLSGGASLPRILFLLRRRRGRVRWPAYRGGMAGERNAVIGGIAESGRCPEAKRFSGSRGVLVSRGAPIRGRSVRWCGGAVSATLGRPAPFGAGGLRRVRTTRTLEVR